MIGSSQIPVTLTPNLPKNDNEEPQSDFWCLLRPKGLPQKTTRPQSKVHKPLQDVIFTEVTCYTSFLSEIENEIEWQLKQKTGFNVSEWWATHHTKFPLMAIAIKKLKCIPGTSSNCQSAFSILTDVVTHKCNKLKGETTHM